MERRLVEIRHAVRSWLNDPIVAARRFHVRLLGIVAIVAMLLCCAGIYGVVHHAVARRTHEIAIRIAENDYEYAAIASISTRAFFGSRATCTVARAG
jgi:hypothetical protein